MSIPALAFKTEALEAFLERIRSRVSPADYEIVSAVVHRLEKFTGLLGETKVSLARLKAIFLGPFTTLPESVVSSGPASPEKQGQSRSPKELRGGAPARDSREKRSR